MTDNFSDPADVQNFLSRYREARGSTARSPPTSPTQPKKIPSRSEAARSVWGSVFHPLGRSPTSAGRYDLSPGQTSKPGMSASEVHAKGTGISLDAIQED